MARNRSRSRTRRRFLAELGLGSAGLAIGCASEGGPSTPRPDASASDAGRVHADALTPGADARPTPGPDGRRPNILYIYTDQHRGDALGTMDPLLQTPNLDSLAAQAVSFRRCFTSAPLCRPARASMMTGDYPLAHGSWTNDQVADPDGPSHVRRLRDEAGYLTAVIGKTHLHDGHGHLDAHRGILERWGFERILELTGPGESATLEHAWTDALGPRYATFLDHMERPAPVRRFPGVAFAARENGG